MPGFPGGIHFVSLAALSDPGLVTSTVAEALEIRETNGQPLVQSVRDAIGARQMLLILDNFEHLLPAGPLVTELLAACPRLKALVTSREALRLDGEQVYPVPPLMLPDAESLSLAGDLPSEFTESEAVRLFTDRAASVRPDLPARHPERRSGERDLRAPGWAPAGDRAGGSTDSSPDTCSHGVRLRSRLQLLTGGPRDVPAREQTLRSAIAWSYDLLDEHERRLFRCLAVFVGGFTLEMAEAVCTTQDDVGIDLLDRLGSLVDKSLVLLTQTVEGQPRYRMLETIREFALERLESSGEAAALRRQHAEQYLMLTEAAEPKLRHGGEQARWLTWFDGEHDNLRAALAWSQADPEGCELGLRLATALYWFWEGRGKLEEGREWLEKAVARAQHAPVAATVRALWALGSALRFQGDYGRSVALHEEGLALSRAANDRAGIAQGLGELGTTARHQADYARTAMLFEEAEQLFRGSWRWSRNRLVARQSRTRPPGCRRP